MKRRLNKESHQKAVNVDNFNKIQLESNSNILPVGDVSNTVNVADQFNKERQASSYYRITGAICPMFTNVLFNSKGVTSSWFALNGDLFRDGTFPPNGVNIDEEEDLTYNESIARHLKERDGWYGYLDPDLSKDSICKWIDMEPNRELFNLSSVAKNWELVITYPIKEDVPTTDNMTRRGVQIISSEPIVIGGRNMTLFSTPIKHGLSTGDSVKLKNFENSSNENVADAIYKVVKVGKSNGDYPEYYFSVDIPTIMVVTPTSRMARFYNGKESSYYYRKFGKIKTRTSEFMERDDYEIFPLAFSQSIFEDKVNQFVINEDIDVSNLTDNLDRPISEIYVTIIKTDSKVGDTPSFTNIKSGIDMPFNENITDTDIPDIRRITDGGLSHKELPGESNITIQSNSFYGDIVEYNPLELREKVLGEVYHRFNTPNRVTAGEMIVNPNFVTGEDIDLGVRREGYIYKPHHKIKIREFSTYIEQGTKDTYNLPSYAIDLKDGRFIWRDLLDIGFNDMHEDFLDYPFLNGSHYLSLNMRFPLKRQDPFGLYGLQHTNPPSDIPGVLMDDNIIVKNSEDVC
jgi:hypothetical protein